MGKKTYDGFPVPPGWPWKGSGEPPSEQARTQLALLGGRRLRGLIRKARVHGGVVQLHGWEFSVAQLTAALKKGSS